MQKCKQCEWEFPDDIRICPYCGHPAEPEDKKQKRRFNLQGRPNLPGGVKQPLPGLQPSQPAPTTPSKKHIQLAIIVSTIIVALVLTGVLWARAILAPTSPQDQTLTVSPSFLDFGPVRVGSKLVLSVIIMKSSESRLNWQISPANVQWLQIALRPKAGQSSNLMEDIYNVTANTSKLNVGKYSALLHFSSERGTTQQVTVKIQVVKNNPPVKLNINPLSLDFGSLQGGDQKTLLLTVSNSGGQELRWTAAKGKTPWLTLDHYSGKIAAGAVPQGINVMVDTTTLTADHYSTTINFSSNGGNAAVVVRLILIPLRTGITVTPSSTLMPTPASIQRQITSPQTQSQTVKATGSGQTEATNATGTLTFTNQGTSTESYPAGSIYVSNSGVQIVIDANAKVPPLDPDNHPSSVSVSARAAKPGAAGNIAAGDVNTCVSPPDPDGCTVTVKNDAAFTDGQDAQIYTFVQQSDINEAATSLTNSTQQSAIDDIHQHLQPNEHLVGDPQCSSNVSPDHKVGDRVSQLTVTVTTTCKATAST